MLLLRINVKIDGKRKKQKKIEEKRSNWVCVCVRGGERVSVCAVQQPMGQQQYIIIIIIIISIIINIMQPQRQQHLHQYSLTTICYGKNRHRFLKWYHCRCTRRKADRSTDKANVRVGRTRTPLKTRPYTHGRWVGRSGKPRKTTDGPTRR